MGKGLFRQAENKRETRPEADTGQKKARDLISQRVIVKNTLLNLLGYGAPLLVAIITIPMLIRGLGTEKFGILTLIWILFSYIGLMDMGLGRALIHLVAEKLGAGREEEVAAVIWTSMIVLLLTGIAVGGLVAVCLPWLIKGVLNIPPAYQKETLDAFYLIAGFVPLIIISISLRGVLDAYQRFDLSNLVRIPFGIYTFVAPVLILPFSSSLFLIVVLLLAGRIIVCAVQAVFCLQLVPSLARGIVFNRELARVLVTFGGWMTVTNIISPIMIYMDRFFISSLISVAAAAYYATPGEVVTKLALLSGAVTAVYFPAFSSAWVQDRKRFDQMFMNGIKYVYMVIFPLCALIVLFSHEGLTLWLGSDFAQQSFGVMQILSIGVFFLCLGQVPFTLIQGAGRPDISAKLHLLEFPFYVILLYFLTDSYGISGAAVAWGIRFGVDSAILFYLAMVLSGKKSVCTSWLAVVAVVTAAVFGSAFLPMGGFQKIVYAGFFLLFYLAFAWFYMLDDGERAGIRRIAGQART